MENEEHYITSNLKSLLSLWLPLSIFSLLSPSVFHLSSPSVGIYMPMTFCGFLLFFAFYLHVSGFHDLMVLRCTESNLLCDSQTILPAITLIHSGQWILMTMKPGSCEDILEALVLVTLVRLSMWWQSRSIDLWKRCSILVFFCWSVLKKNLNILTSQISMHVSCFYAKCLLGIIFFPTLFSSRSIWNRGVLTTAPRLPGHCTLQSGLTFFMNCTTM